MSGTQYFIGDFDGTQFSLDSLFDIDLKEKGAFWLDWGRDNYAGVTWSDDSWEPASRKFMGWMSNWDYAQVVPTQKWRSAMTLPRDILLTDFKGSPRLRSPIDFYETELKDTLWFGFDVEDAENGRLEIHDKIDDFNGLASLNINLIPEEIEGNEIGVELYNDIGESYKCWYNFNDQKLYSDRTNAGKNDFSEKFAREIHVAEVENPISYEVNDKEHMHIEMIFDHSSAELNINFGRTLMTDIFFPTKNFTKLALISDGPFKLWEVRMTKKKSIWRKKENNSKK